MPRMLRKLNTNTDFRNTKRLCNLTVMKKKTLFCQWSKDVTVTKTVFHGTKNSGVRTGRRVYHRSPVPPSCGTAATWAAPAHAGYSPRSGPCASFGWHLGERAAGTTAYGPRLGRRACWCLALEQKLNDKEQTSLKCISTLPVLAIILGLSYSPRQWHYWRQSLFLVDSKILDLGARRKDILLLKWKK